MKCFFLLRFAHFSKFSMYAWVKKEGEKLPQITLDNEMFFSFAFCTFFKIFHVRLGKKVKVLVFRECMYV